MGQQEDRFTLAWKAGVPPPELSPAPGSTYSSTLEASGGAPVSVSNPLEKNIRLKKASSLTYTVVPRGGGEAARGTHQCTPPAQQLSARAAPPAGGARGVACLRSPSV